MWHRWLGLMGWGVAGLVLLLVAAGRAASQATPPQGAFVRAQDGTMYAVAYGTRFRINPLTDTGSLLSGLSDGPTVATVDELNNAIAAAAPPIPPSNPAQTLIGQSITACGERGGTPFQVTVTGADWQRTIASHTARGNAMWVVLSVDITNLGNADAGPYQAVAPVIKLVDERGREHTTLFFEPYYTISGDLAREYGLANFLDVIKPGITESRVIAFEVPPDVQRLTLTSLNPCA
jgi:hypothetical protein